MPAANVTLWQDGQLWQHTKYVITPSDNPQMSGLHNNDEGHYLYGYVFQGTYTVMAEKDGFRGSATGYTDADTVNLNVTIGGYRVPVFTKEQLSCAGAITGTVYELSGHAVTDGANISLWQDGRMLVWPGNPQTGTGDKYLFEHLPSGQYEVRAVMLYPVFRHYPANVTANVSDRTVTVDLILPFAGPEHGIVTPPAPSPSIEPVSPYPTSAMNSTGSPFTDFLTVVLLIAITALIILIHARRKQ